MDRVNQSKVWKHFTRDYNDDKAKCIHCSQNISCKGGSTSGLFRHLKSKHNLNSSESKDQPCSKKVKVQQKSILPFVSVKKESLQGIVSQLAAVDGFSLHSIGKSKFIRESLSAKGLRLPSWDSDIMNLIHHEYDDIQKQIKTEIEMKLKGDFRFSVIMDEYTSVRCRRYMNINIHCQNNVINLGLIRMRDSCGAEKIFQLLEKQLAHFGITNMQTSIVSIVSDGASVTKKLGKISQLDHQLCYAHGVHLAVCDVLYKNRSVTHIAGEDYDDDQDEEMYKEGFGIVTPTIASNEVPVFNLEIENVLKKVRKVVKIFWKSPVKNKALQKYVLLEQNKRLSLVLDCKTRWNSMYKMVERFICLKKCIMKDYSIFRLNMAYLQLNFRFLMS